MKVFVGDSADMAWKKAVQAILEGPDTAKVPSRAGNTLELLHASLVVRNPRRRWVTSRSPALNIAFALAEVVWIIAGRSDVKFVQHWNSQYPKFVGTSRSAHAAYGMRLRKRFAIDQLSRAYRVLRSNPDSRQVVLNVWSASDDFPFKTGRPRAGDIPCNLVACLRLSAGRLEWMQVLRSNDVFLGFPHNVVQFTYLQEVLAGWLNVQPGTYTHVVSSLHAYEKHRNVFTIKERARQLSEMLDVRLPYSESQKCWRHLEQLCVDMVRRGQRGLKRGLPTSPLLPPAMNAIYKVIAAEHSRRTGHLSGVDNFIGECEDPALVDLWKCWESRLRQGSNVSITKKSAAHHSRSNRH